MTAMRAAVPRALRQPGPADADRIDAAADTGRTLDFTLAAGMSLLDAVAAPLEAARLAGAAVMVRGVRFNPFRYVIPALSSDPVHVAYYSATHAPENEVEVTYGTLTYGEKDGRPFLHCHALWRDQTGQPRGGHVLPTDSVVSAPGQASAFGTERVAMVSRFDPETNFSLFRPVASIPSQPSDAASARCIMVRIKPNVDLVEGVEAVCRRHGVRHAQVRSGIGSIVGAEFEDGCTIEPHPTEILVLDGRIAPDRHGRPRADLTIALIDTAGRVHEGRPVRGRNPVLICFELVLESAV